MNTQEKKDKEKDVVNNYENYSKRDYERELREELNLTPSKEAKVNELINGIITEKAKGFSRTALIVSTIIFVLGISLIFANFINLYKEEIALRNVGNIDEKDYNKNIGEIGNDLTIIRNYLNKFYLGDIEEKKVWEQTIKGYVKGAGDKYTEYFTEKEWKDFEESLSGEFKGIGIVMMINPDNPDFITIVDVVNGSPAELAGIKSGDLLIKVEDKEITSEDFSKVSDYIKGEESTKVKIQVLRGNSTIEKEIERKELSAENVTSRMVTKDIGMISFDTFTENLSKEFREEYAKLEKSGMKKLILDLRDNTGGELEAAKWILDLFLDKGKVLLTTKNKRGEEEVIKTSKRQEKTVPIVILANDYSASASEVVIGAMLDNDRATFVGEKTYGKGVIQTLIPLDGRGAIKLTTEEYLRPNGDKINGVGIKPDVEVKIKREEKDIFDPKNKKKMDKQIEKAIEILNKK